MTALLMLPLLAGCAAPVFVAGVGATGAVIAAEEREVATVADDTGISLALNREWFRADPALAGALSSRVNEGVVLVTGTVERPEQRLDAIRIAWQVEGVREVINEIEVAGGTGGAGQYARDTAITGQVKTRLLLDRAVRSINFTVVTEAGTVFLMGIAQDQAELDRVIDHARQIPYVRRVVDYVRVKEVVG
ncbi:MAG: BON domain-containing protein [Inquilinus sp.]|nr:BON domain-containing protein [Inquilinus sp.]